MTGSTPVRRTVGPFAGVGTWWRSRQLQKEIGAAVVAPAVSPAAVSRYEVAACRVPSSTAEFSFSFSCVVRWRLVTSDGPRHPNPAGVAVNAVLHRAMAITGVAELTDGERVNAELAAELGTPKADPGGWVQGWAEDIGLSADAEDLTLVTQLQRLRRKRLAWAAEREWECDQRQYLTDSVLRDPGSAVAWWLARHPDEIEEAVRLVGPLARLVSAVHQTEIHPLYREFEPRHQLPGPRSQDGSGPSPITGGGTVGRSSSP
ncbi:MULTISPECIES: hypothetical protein [unclassified Crossiella]|uniref:hypothetical protein n=1 Tax=unclassified Crossiella TaxID=2620835 RepID=UPI001FFE5708|nr:MULTISPECIES: hypothetical protein [unclassified Crossiella]MCK2239551.1 hypothetical protein [Crossiella sp. S99.2]MCK2252246.1 hypothetical protein [Crossiella sp. S99.1]